MANCPQVDLKPVVSNLLSALEKAGISKARTTKLLNQDIAMHSIIGLIGQPCLIQIGQNFQVTKVVSLDYFRNHFAVQVAAPTFQPPNELVPVPLQRLVFDRERGWLAVTPEGSYPIGFVILWQ